MRSPHWLALLLTTGLLTPSAPAAQVQHGLRVPDGFEVTEFADSRLANDICHLTLDPKGRPVVAGRGYIRILVDDDRDGRADRAIDFAAEPKDGAQGMLWEGTSLFVCGDNGFRRFRDADGDGRADGPSELIRFVRTGTEHGAHAIKRGPDGWLYVVCGNSTGIDKSYAQTAGSPIQTPVAGCVLRFSPDLKTSEIVADGFRNPYDIDFNLDGELFTFDSDNERCVSLPWYEFTRFYHVIPGGHHGWLNPQRAQWWRTPPYSCDVAAPLAYLGRGSPTGVVCYRHQQFPAEYHGGFFLLDWTFGKIHFAALERKGSSYQARTRVFLESVGENGFAPTAAAVDPKTGDLYVAIGGRGTRGAVYRVRYTAGLAQALSAGMTGLPKRSTTTSVQELLKQSSASAALHRLQALHEIRRRRPEFSNADVRLAIEANWDYADRYLHQACVDLLASLPRGERLALGGTARAHWSQAALIQVDDEPQSTLRLAVALLESRAASADVRLAAVRALQKLLGDLGSRRGQGTVWEGYSPRAAEVDGDRAAYVLNALRTLFPTGIEDLDRELSRMLAVLEDSEAETLRKVTARLAAATHPVEDMHYLIVLARLGGARSETVTAAVAEALLALDRKLHARGLTRDRHWPLRIAELHSELARKDQRLNEALLAHADFGRPDHALFARVSGFPQRRAAELFLARAGQNAEFAWNADLVALLGALPEERMLPMVGSLWGKAGVDDALLPLLARHPRAEDRDKFLEALATLQPQTVRHALDGLEKLPSSTAGAHLLPVMKALRALTDGKEATALRERLTAYLRKSTGQQTLPAEPQPWTDWFTRTYPELAGRLGGTDGVDVATWNKRLATLDWSQGNADRGRLAFTKANCASCHSGSQALGPDLQGVAGRFSRADLFTSILQPSKDISARYRTTAIETADGKTYQGMVIYEAVDSLILQTGPATTVRLVNHQITGRRPTEISLMPAGLLDKLSDGELADLYAYLKQLGIAKQ